MTEKKEPVQIIAKFVKISGVMVFLEEPEKSACLVYAWIYCVCGVERRIAES